MQLAAEVRQERRQRMAAETKGETKGEAKGGDGGGGGGARAGVSQIDNARHMFLLTLIVLLIRPASYEMTILITAVIMTTPVPTRRSSPTSG